MAQAANVHEASAAALGYLFQCRYALLAGLQAIPQTPQLQISIEKFDDVAFDTNGEPTQLIQTKHHVKKKGNLFDSSVDLWKTLLIWSNLVNKDVETPFRSTFVLLTTGTAPKDSAASFLRQRDRNELEADRLLLQVATRSKSNTNKRAYGVYKNLPENLRINLLKAILILDGSPNIVDVREDIVREVYHAAPRGQINNLVERLEGWWFGQVIRALTGTGLSSIPVFLRLINAWTNCEKSSSGILCRSTTGAKSHHKQL
jgi:hypothetical protein